MGWKGRLGLERGLSNSLGVPPAGLHPSIHSPILADRRLYRKRAMKPVASWRDMFAAEIRWNLLWQSAAGIKDTFSPAPKRRSSG